MRYSYPSNLCAPNGQLERRALQEITMSLPGLTVQALAYAHELGGSSLSG